MGGYVSAKTTFVVKRKLQLVHVPVSKQMPVGEMRVVLGWGATPSDLDLHILVPDQLRRRSRVRDEDVAGHVDKEDRKSHREISWSATGTKTRAPFAVLENDQTNGYGPETIHTYKAMHGVYYVFVDCFSTENFRSFARSHAYVNVYSGNHQVFHGDISHAKGRPHKYWHVLNLDCRKADRRRPCKMIPINRFVPVAPAPKNLELH